MTKAVQPVGGGGRTSARAPLLPAVPSAPRCLSSHRRTPTAESRSCAQTSAERQVHPGRAKHRHCPTFPSPAASSLHREGAEQCSQCPQLQDRQPRCECRLPPRQMPQLHGAGFLMEHHGCPGLDTALPVQVLNRDTSEHRWSSAWREGRKPRFPSTMPTGGMHPAPLLSPKPIVLLSVLDHIESTQF